ncbi:MAG: ABC transporter permease [Myxococcota bacterium]
MKLLRLAFGSALRALRRNVLRTGLTVIGISIGVAAVITMVGIGQGAGQSLQDSIRALGRNLLVIVPGSLTSAGVRTGSGGIHTLTTHDARAILRDIPSVADVTYVRRGVVQVVYGNRNWSTFVHGTTPEFESVMNSPVDEGVFFTQRDLRTGASVVVLGRTVVDELFGVGADPIDAVVRIDGVPFQVVGVLRAKGQTAWGQDRDDLLVIPFSTAERRVLGTPFPGRVDQVLVSAASDGEVMQASLEIQSLLRERHRIRSGEGDDFQVRTLEALIMTARATAGVMTAVLMSISSISLLVGGIGIMNILLVSVTERTREIGIRMAVGAKRRHILLQFLVEATVLSTIGGLIGIMAGLGATYLIAVFVGWPLMTPLFAVVGAVLFSASVGVFFGFYPARRAASLDPITALRFE